MKTLLAYSILVIGIPNYVGVISGVIFMPLAWPFPDSQRARVIQFLNFPKGVIAITAALVLFHLMTVPASAAVLYVTLAWISLYYMLLKQPFIGWLSFAAGIVTGWYVFHPWLSR